MKTVKYYDTDIDKIVDCLNNDGVLAVNTDTVMGLCIASDSRIAFDKLMEAKHRPANKLFPVMVSDVAMMKTIVDINDRDIKIIEAFLPGQLTLILKKKENSDLLLESDTVAVRIVEDDLLIEIVKKFNKPIFLTSANKSGEGTTKLAREVVDIFDGTIDGVLMKDANGYEASTIVDLTKTDLAILRPGHISEEEIRKSLEED